MADNTLIEWADSTCNAVNGCSVISPGCTNCYAMKLAGTRLRNHPSRTGLTDQTKAGPVWNGTVRLEEKQLLQPLRWKRPRRIFWNAHGDLFHDAVSNEWIDRVFVVCALTPQHQHLILTKRSARMREYLQYSARRLLGIAGQIGTIGGILGQSVAINQAASARLDSWPLPNVWLGVSVEDQARADQRIPDLLATPAAVRFISAEPLLGPVDLRWIAEPDDEKDGVIDALLGCNWIDYSHTNKGEVFRPVRPGHEDRLMRRWVCSPESEILAGRKLDWVIIGGESGPGARPMHPDWARSLRDQCQAAGVPFFFKQWGEWGPDAGPLDQCHKGTSIRRDPIFEGTARCAVLVDGNWQHFESGYGPPIELCSGHGEHVYRLGKKRNGNLLDGQHHMEFPA